jgi:hypothetical protein
VEIVATVKELGLLVEFMLFWICMRFKPDSWNLQIFHFIKVFAQVTIFFSKIQQKEK